MKRRFVRTVLAALAVGAAMSAAPAADAQELQLTGPLKGAPAVRHLRLYRQGRFEIAPSVSFSLLDEYRRTILVGARLNYNITDWLAIGVWGAGGVVSTTTYLTDHIDTTSPRDQLTAINVAHSGNPYGQARGVPPLSFADQTAKISYVVSPQVTFIPFRGKLAIFNKIFVDTDLYVAGGVGVVGLQQRGTCSPTGTPCASPSSFAVSSTTQIAPTGALGLTFYPGGFWSLGVELRALPFWWNRSGFDTRGGGPNGQFPDGAVTDADSTFKFNTLVTVAIGFYIPTKPTISE